LAYAQPHHDLGRALTDPQKFWFFRCGFVVITMLALAWQARGPAYAQGAATAPVFFTQAQYQTSQARNQLEPGGLASCSVPNVTITHSPGYVVPSAAPKMIFANLAATPHAVCNDGSPAAFLFRKGFGAAASRWVIYLDGGGECYNQKSCIQRQDNDPEDLISSVPYSTGTEPFTPINGILSPNPALNPDFYDANLVQVAYCSSDLWMGEKDGNKALTPALIRASRNVANWYFDGHGVVQAVIQILQQNYGLNNASDVLLAGGSAGAYGVFMNANFVSGLLPLTTRFVALPDSGYSPSNYPDYDSATGGDAPPPTNTQVVMQDGQNLWASVGDFDCAYTSRHAANGVHNLACDDPDKLARNASYRIPLFIRSSFMDATILDTYNVTQPVTSEEQPYVTNFDNAMAQSLNSTIGWLSVFGLNITHHTIIKNSTFTADTFSFPDATSSTLAAAVGVWYRQPCAAPRWMQSPTQQ
jgi:hypothetical protein